MKRLALTMRSGVAAYQRLLVSMGIGVHVTISDFTPHWLSPCDMQCASSKMPEHLLVHENVQQ